MLEASSVCASAASVDSEVSSVVVVASAVVSVVVVALASADEVWLLF